MISRRDFLKQSMAVVAMGAGVPGVFAKAALASRAEASAGAARTLVVVQLAGGVDGLNALVPHGSPAYRDNRPRLAIPEDQVLDIGGGFGLHPALADFKQLLDAGHLAVVQGVGYPNPNFSHFKAMDIWQSADPDGKAADGWLGRYFDGLVDASGHPLAGLSVGRSLPRSFQAREATLPAVGSLESFALQGPRNSEDAASRQTSLLRLYDVYQPAGTPFAALLDATLDGAVQSSAELMAAHAAYRPAVEYPDSSLATGLRLLAELIDSGDEASPLRVGHVTLGGFDTHAQQPAVLEALLAQLGAALSAFWQDVAAHGHGDDVLVMTWSEFGRRVRENANLGTDHGSVGPMFLIGNAVKPGLHGEPPSLTNLDDGNLRYTVDFRSVYAAVLEGWLEAPADEILGAHFEPVGVLKT
jgi:uncharacterized protein (DUF1501 family)